MSAGCLCVDRFKKIVLLSVGVCRRVSAGCLCVDRFKKNWIVVCQCVSSCVGRLFMCRKVQEKLCCCVSVCVIMCRQVVSVCVGE